MKKTFSWTSNKLVVLLVLAAYFLLMMELRFEHMDELGKHWQAWIPIAFSGVMVVAGIAALRLWEKGGRKVLFWGFATSLIVGLLGVWFHTKGKPLNSIRVVAAAWQAPLTKHHDKPAPTDAAPKKKKKKPKPPLAPLSFAGIGLLGMLGCQENSEDKTDV